jgi:CRP-like cAMP-binding protein
VKENIPKLGLYRPLNRPSHEYSSFQKKTILLKEGQVSNYMYFIESGLLRIYYIKDDKEICSGLVYLLRGTGAVVHRLS